MKKENGGKIYGEEEPFSMVSNSALRDNKLSLKAKGLYALIKSYITLKNFTLYKNTLKKECLEKEKAFESTWKELKDNGYLIQYRFQDKKGQYYYEYKLLSCSNSELATEIHDKQNRKCKEEKNHIPQKEGMDKNIKNHTPKKDNMDKGYDGQRGVYNNTDFTNTNLNNTNTCSSSKHENEIDLIKEFEANICELKKTTKIKFGEVIKKYDADFILSILEQCCNSNIKAYAGFEKVFNSYLNRNCDSRQTVEKATEEYKVKHIKKDSKANTGANKGKGTGFNNFEPREYDYKDLENKLLSKNEEDSGNNVMNLLNKYKTE